MILPNFASPLAVDLGADGVVRAWAAQAPREMWIARPGDVLVSPVPLDAAFVRYACRLLGVPADSVRVLAVPDVPGRPMADNLLRDPVLGRLRELAAARPGIRLLPTALDRPVADLAAALAIAVEPYPGDGGQGVGEDALASADLLNTKSGFRDAAHRAGIRVPAGRVCAGPELACVVTELLRDHASLVAKPDRSAGGHGIRFLDRDRVHLPAEPGSGTWVVERRVPHERSVSAQFDAGVDGVRMEFAGEMRVSGATFAGYCAPLPDADPVTGELRAWGLALGKHLTAHGYLGPYGVDAVVESGTGVPYATEANVRRTATSTPHAMVRRLTAGPQGPDAPAGGPAWSTGSRAVAVTGRETFRWLLRRVESAGLAFDPATGEGIVLYAGGPVDGVVRYAAVAADPARRAEVEAAFHAVPLD